MPKGKKVTSKRVARISSKLLKDKKQDKASKSAAGSALSQREKKSRKRRT